MGRVTSDLAAIDLERLRADGLAPSDEDVIRLHALALRISDGPERTCWRKPRHALAGVEILWEPTVAALLWMDHASSVDCGIDDDILAAYACAKGRSPVLLASLAAPRQIRTAVHAWLKTLGCTVRELLDAARYAIEGVGEPVPDPTPMAARRQDWDPDPIAVLERYVAEAAAATGLTMGDILAQTPSALAGMIHASHVEAGEPLTSAVARCHADYLATLAAIRKRLEGQSARAPNQASSADKTAIPSTIAASRSPHDSGSFPRPSGQASMVPSLKPSQKDFSKDNMSGIVNGTEGYGQA
ncbi:MAG: hypothetical protein J6334_02545 [Kiritimatiellae bacterium]|nr:hypothetical protein [Kiritimatiellia bacterium]